MYGCSQSFEKSLPDNNIFLALFSIALGLISECQSFLFRGYFRIAKF